MVLWRAVNQRGVNGEFLPGEEIFEEFLHAALTVNTEANKALEALTLVAPNESEARCALAGLCKWAVQLGFFFKKNTRETGWCFAMFVAGVFVFIFWEKNKGSILMILAAFLPFISWWGQFQVFSSQVSSGVFAAWSIRVFARQWY